MEFEKKLKSKVARYFNFTRSIFPYMSTLNNTTNSTALHQIVKINLLHNMKFSRLHVSQRTANKAEIYLAVTPTETNYNKELQMSPSNNNPSLPPNPFYTREGSTEQGIGRSFEIPTGINLSLDKPKGVFL
jgi:hypothetical protein